MRVYAGQAQKQWECWKQGRHFVGKYPWPKGDEEAARLDLQNAILKAGLGGNVFAPLAPRRILALAAGSGIWCVQVARQFPQAEVVGSDLDPDPFKAVQARLGRAHQFPGNCHFDPKPVDILRPLPYADASFDLVHSRHVGVFVPAASWLPYLREMQRLLVPGGWLQLVESEFPDCAGPHYQAMKQAFVRWSTARLGFYNIGERFGAMLEAIGIAAPQVQRRVIGSGATAPLQPKIVANIQQGMTLSAGAIVREGIMSQAEVAAHLAETPREMQAGITWTVYIGLGQKPN